MSTYDLADNVSSGVEPLGGSDHPEGKVGRNPERDTENRGCWLHTDVAEQPGCVRTRGSAALSSALRRMGCGADP